VKNSNPANRFLQFLCEGHELASSLVMEIAKAWSLSSNKKVATTSIRQAKDHRSNCPLSSPGMKKRSLHPTTHHRTYLNDKRRPYLQYLLQIEGGGWSGLVACLYLFCLPSSWLRVRRAPGRCISRSEGSSCSICRCALSANTLGTISTIHSLHLRSSPHDGGKRSDTAVQLSLFLRDREREREEREW
jgi:hypothetical protein